MIPGNRKLFILVDIFLARGNAEAEPYVFASNTKVVQADPSLYISVSKVRCLFNIMYEYIPLQLSRE